MDKGGKHTIVVNGLSVGYGSTKVAENINFSLKSGELCAIVGVNGIGKSTLLRTLAQLQPKLDGEIELFGQKPSQFRPTALSKQLSLVLTDPVASKNMTVQELIALGRQPYTNWLGVLGSDDKEKIQECIQTFDLQKLQHQKCHELSDGQLQRVLIARAMAQDTPVILLDEPTTHLDLFHKVQILKSLQQLAHVYQKTILYTTHEIDLAIQLCDKILILNGVENPFGQPNELIGQKHFERLFPKSMIVFDAQSGSFKVKK